MLTPPNLSVRDRLEYGVIAAFFGLLVSGLISLLMVVLSLRFVAAMWPFNPWLVWFSLAYFFVMGMFRGADAAQAIVLGLAIGLSGALQANASPHTSSPNGEPSGWQRGHWWSAIYFVVVALIVWKGN